MRVAKKPRQDFTYSTNDEMSRDDLYYEFYDVSLSRCNEDWKVQIVLSIETISRNEDTLSYRFKYLQNNEGTLNASTREKNEQNQPIQYPTHRGRK